jgi:hypothetical protein
MGAITAIDATQRGAFAAAPTTLTTDDTFTLDATKKQLLVLRNPTGGSITHTLDGTTGTTVAVDGIGNIDVSAGLAIVVGAGLTVAVVLSTVRQYCQGVAHILSSGAGGTATLYNL